MLMHLNRVPTPPPRAVVMGARGFVGRHLVRHLDKLGVPTLALSSAAIDLCQPDSIAALRSSLRPDDALVFVSAITPDRGRDLGTFMRNLVMGQHVCACLETAPCSHVLYVSSDAVYGEDATPVRETSYCNPSSFHGLMHLVRERMLVQTLNASGTPLAILRPSLLYGAGDTHNGYGPNRFLRSALAERKILLFGRGEEKRDHVYVGDLCGLVALCLQHRSQGFLNVATGTSCSFFAVADTVRALCKSGVEIECLPRTTPITHRHFDTVAMMRAFPTFQCLGLQESLAQTLQSLVEGS